MERPGTEDVEAVKQALVKLMAIADRLDTRNQQTVQQLEAASLALDQGVNRLSAGGEQFAGRALQVISGSTQQAIAQGAGQAVVQLREQLQHSAAAAQSAAQAMALQSRCLTNARRHLVWSGMIALLLGSLLAAGGAAWVAQRSMQEITRAQFGKDILQATERGALSRCGEMLCARIGRKPRRYGKDGDYALLEP